MSPANPKALTVDEWAQQVIDAGWEEVLAAQNKTPDAPVSGY